MGSSADRCRGQEEGGGRCEKQGVCRLTRGMENRRPCFEVGRSNPSFSGKDINACNSKRNLQGCLFLFSKRKKMEPERRAVWDLPPTAAGGRRRERTRNRKCVLDVVFSFYLWLDFHSQNEQKKGNQFFAIDCLWIRYLVASICIRYARLRQAFRWTVYQILSLVPLLCLRYGYGRVWRKVCK